MNIKITTGLLAVLVTAATSGITSDYDFDFIAVADAATPDTTTAESPAQKSPAPVEPKADARHAPPTASDRFDDPYSTGQWDPYREIQRMQEQMDRIMQQAFDRYGLDPSNDPYFSDPYYDRHYGPRGTPRFGPGYGRGPGPGLRHGPGFRHQMRGALSPAMDLQDKGDNYVVLIDVPGMDADSISVTLEHNRLSISAKQRYEKEDKDSQGNVIFRERRSGSFKRSLSLPGPVKEGGMKTEFDKGVLRITIPKA